MKSKKNLILKSDSDKNKEIETIFFRLIFVGDIGVGKTQIINIYNKKQFKEKHIPTFSVDFQIKPIYLNGKKINIHCIDTEGSSDFKEDTGESFVKRADAFILVYDISQRQTFDNLPKYYEMFKFALNDIEERFSKKIIYIVGNKSDLRAKRIVLEKEGKELANKYDAKFIEVSAKNGSYINIFFDHLIQDILKRDENSSSDSGGHIKNNSILNNVNTIRSNKSLKNTNRNGNFTENESALNYETSSYFLKTKNSINNNNEYIKNINNYQMNRTNDISKNPIYYYNNQDSKKCLIF